MTGATPASPTWAIVAGGGTAGHVVPGLAVGRALVERGHPASSIHYVGSERGLEADMVPAGRLRAHRAARAGASPGKLSAQGMVDNAGAAWG